MKAEEFMNYLDQDEINRAARDIGAVIKIQPVDRVYRIDDETDCISVDITFLGICKHANVILSDDYINRYTINDQMKRFIFSIMVNIFSDHLCSVLNISRMKETKEEKLIEFRV